MEGEEATVSGAGKGAFRKRTGQAKERLLLRLPGSTSGYGAVKVVKTQPSRQVDPSVTQVIH